MELLVIKEYMDWKGSSDRGTEKRVMDASESSDVQQAEILLTFQCCTLFQRVTASYPRRQVRGICYVKALKYGNTN